MHKRSALISVSLASVLLLSACSGADSTPSTEEAKEPQTIQDVENIELTHGVSLLGDGRYVGCVLSNAYDSAYLTCDWENTTTVEPDFDDDVVFLHPASFVSTITGVTNYCVLSTPYDSAKMDCEFDQER